MIHWLFRTLALLCLCNCATYFAQADDEQSFSPYLSMESYTAAKSRWQQSLPDHKRLNRELLLASRNVYRPGQKSLTSLEAVTNLNGLFAAACEIGFQPSAEEFLGLWLRSVDNVDSGMAKAVSLIENDDSYRSRFLFRKAKWSRDAATRPSNTLYEIYETHCTGTIADLTGPNGTNLADVYLALLMEGGIIDKPNAHASLAFFQTLGIHPTLRNPEGGENHILIDRFNDAAAILGWARGMTGDDLYTPAKYQDHHGNSLAHFIFSEGPGYTFQQRYRFATQRLNVNFDLANRDGYTAQGIINASPAYQQGIQNVRQQIAAEHQAERQRRLWEAQREAQRQAQQDRLIAAAMGLVIQSYGTSQMIGAGADPTVASNFGRSVAFDAVSQIDPQLAESFRPVYTPPPRPISRSESGRRQGEISAARSASEESSDETRSTSLNLPDRSDGEDNVAPIRCYYAWFWMGYYYTDPEFLNERYGHVISSVLPLDRGFIPTVSWTDRMIEAAKREGELMKPLFEQEAAPYNYASRVGPNATGGNPWINESSGIWTACDRHITSAEVEQNPNASIWMVRDGDDVENLRDYVKSRVRNALSHNVNQNDTVSSSVQRPTKDISRYN